MRVGQTAARSGAGAPAASLILGRYRLQRRLGAGGFGTVWMARDQHLERDVAVKILPCERIVGGRFDREARAAARLSHPAIVTLYEAAADEEGAYLVSELVRGTTLDLALRDGQLSDRGILALGTALCEALAHAHAHGIVHRDVKPSNILIPSRPASAPPAKLTDFGVARVVGGDALTHTGELVGTWQYMAPEQAMGRPAGEEADLYSLAVVLYEALTGVNPVAATCPRSQRRGQHVPPLRRQRRELPRELGQAVDQALRPRVRERGSLVELSTALRTAADAVGDVAGVVGPPRLAAWRRRGWLTAQARKELGTGPVPTADDPAARPEPTSEPAPTADDPAARPEPTSEQATGAGRGGRRAADTIGSGQLTAPTAAAALTTAAPESPNPAVALPDHDLALPDSSPLRPRAGPFERLAAAAAAAGLATWISSSLLAVSPVPPATLAPVTALIVVVAPRPGWLLTGLIAAVALSLQHRSGMAVLLVTGIVAPVLAMPRRGSAWPLAMLAPALGAIGLAGAWPAVAAYARSPWRRAALAGVGWWWLCVGPVLAGHRLYLHPVAVATAVWADSPYATVHHVLRPLLAGPAPLGAAVWALAAVALPMLRRPARGARRPENRLAGVVVALAWSALLAAATILALELTGAGHLAPTVAVWTAGAGGGTVAALAQWPTGAGATIPSETARFA